MTGKPHRSRRVVAAFLPLAIVLGIVGVLAVPRSCAEEVKGKYLLIDCPPGEKGTGERLAKIGDNALDLYAGVLGAQVPQQPFKVFLFATIPDYQKAEFLRTKGAFKDNLAFTHRDTTDILMYIPPRPGRGAGGEPGMMEALFTHELVHALMYRLYQSGGSFPDWLFEGLADTWSERAVAGADAYCAEKSPWYAAFVLDARQALEEGRFIPLEKLLTESWVGHDFLYRQTLYAEGFTLVRWLDAPGKDKADQERRAKFMELLQAACAMPKADDTPAKISDKFRQTYGNLVTLERDWVHDVMTEPTFPWQIQLREIRAAADGALVAETFPDNTALAFSTQPPVGPIARIEAEIEVDPSVGHRQANIVFGGRGRDFFYFMAYEPNAVSLMRFSGKYEMLATQRFDASLMGPGKHLLQVDVACAHVWAKIDTKPVMHFVLPEGVFGKGRWGIGAYDARVTFRNAKAENK